jgi:hypothetical protein
VDAQLGDMYAACGLDERAQAIRAVLAKCAAVSRDTTQLDRDLKAELDACVYSVINGEATTLEAALRLSDARRVASSGKEVGEIAQLVRQTLHFLICRAMWTEGDALLAELDTVVQASVNTITKTAPGAAGISNDAQAVRASPAAQRAWAAMTVECERIRACWGLARVLRVQTFVADLREAGDDDWCYRLPELVTEYDPKRHPVCTMLDDIEAEPCVASADQILERVWPT